MIAEILLILAGHSSSLFDAENNLHSAFSSLLHPGEQQCLESLGQIAYRYRKIKASCRTLSISNSRYVSALCSALNSILKDEYEALVVETEARVLRKDPSLVATGSSVPLSSLRATFSVWDAPLAALELLVEHLQTEVSWKPGPLIDLLMVRSQTGVHKVSDILSLLSNAVQKVWRIQLIAFLVHGTGSETDGLVTKDYRLHEGSMPSCISAQSKDSISYVGRALATVKSKKWQTQLPRTLALEHTKLLESVFPADRHSFDEAIMNIRTNISEWLWLNVLTRGDVEDAVHSLADYFLLRNGEFSLSIIREIERLKVSRLTLRSGSTSVIREQDLNLAILRASLGTTAQHDPSLSRLRFHLPSGPLRPLLPSLANSRQLGASQSIASNITEQTIFDDLLLGTPLVLTYNIAWPLDLFLHLSDLRLYATLFAFLSSLRKTHTRIHTCWADISNAQRARRRWTGLGEGGTVEDLQARKELLRCGWGVVRDMGWFLDTLLGYVMTDVVDVEFRRLKNLLDKPPGTGDPPQLTKRLAEVDPIEASDQATGSRKKPRSRANSTQSDSATSWSHLDFTTIRNMHTTYLERVLTGCLLLNPTVAAVLRPIFEVCERFVAQVERWGGDILPALLFEGSLSAGGDAGVGDMVKERLSTVSEINETLHTLLEMFYEQLSLSTSQQPFAASADASKSMVLNASLANASTMHHTFIKQRSSKGLEGHGEVRRHIERLLLRLDFNGSFSSPRPRKHTNGSDDILKQGGLA